MKSLTSKIYELVGFNLKHFNIFVKFETFEENCKYLMASPSIDVTLLLLRISVRFSRTNT